MNTSPDRAAQVALAQQKLAARRLRLQRWRNGSIAGAVAAFALAWGVIFGQLASGNDPALAQSSSTSSTTESTTTSTEDTLVESTDTTPSSSTDDGDAAATESEPTPVTTSQS
jgi:hypothetical protein